MNCNNIKKLSTKASEVVAAVEESDQVELSKDKKSIRRKDNKSLPELNKTSKKRDLKA